MLSSVSHAGVTGVARVGTISRLEPELGLTARHDGLFERRLASPALGEDGARGGLEDPQEAVTNVHARVERGQGLVAVESRLLSELSAHRFLMLRLLPVGL